MYHKNDTMVTSLFLIVLVLVSLSTTFAFAPIQRATKVSLTTRLSSTRAVVDQLEVLLEKGDIDGAIRNIEQQGEGSSIPAELAAKLLNLAATIEQVENSRGVPLLGEKAVRDPIGGGEYTAAELVGSATTFASNTGSRLVNPLQEQRLVQCYTLIKQKLDGIGLFGSKDVRELALPTGSGCSIEQLETFTELPLSAFRPNPTTMRLYWLGGVAAVAAEIIVAQIFQISPQPLFAATFAALLVDQFLGGAYSEKIMWTIFPDMADRVLRHEAGHLLVAHILGCPVQSVTLGAWDALTKDDGGSGERFTGAGTGFFDPELNEASIKGRVSRSVVDRFSVILMAGIAAEALCFGEAEGGSDDEKCLTVFLSQTVQVNQNIPEQARWAATNALTLLREHRDAYERLVMALQKNGSGNVGKIMMALEGFDV